MISPKAEAESLPHGLNTPLSGILDYAHRSRSGILHTPDVVFLYYIYYQINTDLT